MLSKSGQTSLHSVIQVALDAGKVLKKKFTREKKVSFKEAENIGKKIIKLFEENQFDICRIFYNKFKNVITQIPQVQQIIPVENLENKNEKKNSRKFL